MGTYLVPVTVKVRINLVISKAESKKEANAKAAAYMKKNYNDPDEPCFIEGQRIKNTFEVEGKDTREAGPDANIPAQWNVKGD